MESTPKFLLEIRQRLAELSGNNRVIAERIIDYPEEVLQSKVSEFAERCHCDSAQVVRLCQKLGYDGFTSLKNRIAMELIDPKRTLHRQIAEPATSFEQLKRNFALNFTRTINDTLANLDEKAIEQAVSLIRNARHIVVHGFGSSGLAARDLRIKLVRIGYYAMFPDDAEYTRTLVATCDDRVARVGERTTGVIFAAGELDAAGDTAVGRDLGQRDFNQPSDVLDHEGCRLQRGGEKFGVDSVAGVVDAGVVPRELQHVVR